MIFKLPIAISISPNTDDNDFRQALKILIQPWKWKEGQTITEIEQWFKNYFKVEDAVSFSSGRSALYGILQVFGIGKDDEILVQAFTCVAAIEPIIWIGAKPVYVDIDDTLNIDLVALEKHINKKTRAIIVQHTFGVPADIKKIKKITQKYNLILIEDCALALGASVRNTNVGKFGDAAYFSFGRDKVISSVFGGMAIINSKFPAKVSQRRPASGSGWSSSGGKNQKLRSFQRKLDYPSYFWILQQLLHPLVFTLILPISNLVIGKIIIVMLQKLNLLSKPYQQGEYSGLKPAMYPAKYPNALAVLIYQQLQKLERMNKRRIENANYYFNHIKSDKNLRLPVKKEGSIYLRFNILINNADKIIRSAKKKGMLLGNWYRNTIDPVGVEYQRIGYRVGSCPQAERTAKLSLNLPTYHRLSQEQLDVIIEILK